MKKILLFMLLLVISQGAFSRPQTRAVVMDTVCEVPMKDLVPVINKFARQFQSCPDSLFYWAYIGTGELEIAESRNKESRDAIQLDYKDRWYDASTKTGDVAIDIYVLGIRWWKDQHLGTVYSLTRPASAQYPLTGHLRATYTGSILEEGNIIFRMEPVSPTRTRVHYEFSLTFGRVLSAFIGDKTWRNAIEWRFETIFENLIEYAETGTIVPRASYGPKKK